MTQTPEYPTRAGIPATQVAARRELVTHGMIAVYVDAEGNTSLRYAPTGQDVILGRWYVAPIPPQVTEPMPGSTKIGADPYAGHASARDWLWKWWPLLIDAAKRIPRDQLERVTGPDWGEQR